MKMKREARGEEGHGRSGGYRTRRTDEGGWADSGTGMKLTRSQITRRHEERNQQAGGMKLPPVDLNPEATAALRELQARGYAPSRTACIVRAIIDATAKRDATTNEGEKDGNAG